MADSSVYPGAIDAVADIPTDITNDTNMGDGTPRTGTVGWAAALFNRFSSAIRKIELELGTDPSGSFTDVAARLSAMQTVRKSADQSNSTVTPANITDLVFPVTVGADHFCEFYVPYSAAATTTGVGFDVDVPTLGAGGYVSLMQQISGRAANPAVGGAMALTTVPYHLHAVADAANPGASEGVAAANAVYLAIIFAVVSNPNAAGNIQLRWRSEVAAASTVKKGAFGRMYVN